MKIIYVLFFILLGTTVFCNASNLSYSDQENMAKDDITQTVVKYMIKGNDYKNTDDKKVQEAYLQAYHLSQGNLNDSLMAEITATLGATYYRLQKNDSARYFYYEALKYLQNQNNPSLASRVHFNLYLHYESLGIMDSTEYYFHAGKKLAEESQDSSVIMFSKFEAARYYQRKGDYSGAIKNFNECIAYNLRHKDYLKLKYEYNNLGITYMKIGALEAARQAYYHGLQVEDPSNSNTDIYLYNNLGELFRNYLNEPDSAFYYYRLSGDLALKNGQERSWLIAMINTGNLYEQLEEYSKAAKIYLEILRHDNISFYHQIKTAVTINLGIIQYQLGRYSDARFYLDEGYRMALEGEYQEYQLNALKFYILLAARDGNGPWAEENLRQYLELKDTLTHHTHTREISELKVVWETDQMEQDNAALRIQNQLKEDIIHRQKTTLVHMIVSILVLAGLIIYISFLLRKRKILNEQLNQYLQKISEQNTLIEKQNKSLSNSNTTKDKLFSIIAHDLRSPLSLILSYLEILDDEACDFDGQRFKQLVKDLRLDVENTSHLLSNLLEWSLAQQNGITNSPEKVVIAKEAERVVSLLGLRIKEKKQTITIAIPSNCVAWCDAQLFRNALLNLLNNAVKFTPNHGAITIKSTQAGNWISVCVIDNGIGIAIENTNKLFTIDSGFHTNGTENEKGTGLGLAMCRDYVHTMGGQLSVDSKEGIGSTFCFTIPSAEGE